MAVNEQPSVLTVCLSAPVADRGEMDLKNVLAAREQAVARSDGVGRDENGSGCARIPCGRIVSDSNTSDAGCEACDDSACGVNALGDASTRLIDADGRKFNDVVCDGSEAESGAGTGNGASFFHADSGKKALELLRMLRFDLLVTGDELPDMSVSQFIRRVRVAWPWQKWAMVGAALSTEAEIEYRSLGAMAVFDAPPDWVSLSLLAATAAERTAGMKLAGTETRGISAVQHVPEELISLDQSDSLMPVSASAGESRAATRAGNGRRAAVLSPGVSKRSVG